MEPIDLWKLSNEFTVRQAALLVIGCDPSDYVHVDNWEVHEQPVGYNAVLNALKNAVRAKSIETFVFTKPNEVGRDELWEPVYEGETEDWEKTVMSADEIKKWLLGRNFRDGFFLDKSDQDEGFFDIHSEFYAPKLAAAVSAWRSLKGNPSLLSGKTPKQAVEKYLRENASRFRLTKDDGLPNEKGIAEICKVANWNPGGGVAKTGTQVQESSAPPLSVVNTGSRAIGEDKRLPF